MSTGPLPATGRSAPPAPPWPEAHPTRGLPGLVATAARTELRAALRSPELLGLGLTVPVLLYAMFGLPVADETLPGGGTVGAAAFVSFAAYGVLTLAISVFGEEVAKERGRGWVRTLYATGYPPAVHLAGKAVAIVVHATIVVVAVAVVAAVAGGVDLPPERWLATGAVLVAGSLLLAPIGSAIAYLARPRTATLVVNVVFLPLSFLSGFFVPLSQLPAWVGAVADWLPSHHLGQLALATVLPEESVADWTGAAGSAPWVHVAWVLGGAVLLSGLAALGAHREAVTRRG